jgi:hypothetical protein
MDVRRNVLGPTNWASALGGRAFWRRHDEWACSHSEESWHEQVLRLRLEAERTPSRAIQAILEREIQQILRG